MPRLACGDYPHRVNQTWDRLRARDSRHPWLLDTVRAAGLLAGGMLATASGPQTRPPDATGYLLLTLGALPYPERRRAPVPVLVLASIPVLALLTLGYESAVIGAGLFLMAYTVADRCRARWTASAAGYMVVLLVAVATLGPRPMLLAEAATDAVVLTGAFALGRSAHDRRHSLALLEDRAEMAARAQVQEARRAVSDERLRIAQEMHDVLAHSLGVIALQARVGAHIIDADPAEAKAALVAVCETSRSSLTEIRRILGALRSDGDRAYRPPPGLDAVGALVASLAAVGLRVVVHVTGAPGHLPASLDLTAYRLIQEALTNVLKHAGQARAGVTIGYEPGAVAIEVLDDGTATGTGPRGHGQLGMRERVAVWGGSLAFGPRAGGGYRVAARLPYGAAA